MSDKGSRTGTPKTSSRKSSKAGTPKGSKSGTPKGSKSNTPLPSEPQNATEEITTEESLAAGACKKPLIISGIFLHLFFKSSFFYSCNLHNYVKRKIFLSLFFYRGIFIEFPPYMSSIA